MPRWLVIDEIHVYLSVPQFDTGAVRAMRRQDSGGATRISAPRRSIGATV